MASVGSSVIRPEWLQPAADGPVCGPNLEYDPEYLDLARASKGEPEKQYGDAVFAAKEPVWSDIAMRSVELLNRSRDIRIVHILTRALTRTRSLGGLRDGLALTKDLLEGFTR